MLQKVKKYPAVRRDIWESAYLFFLSLRYWAGVQPTTARNAWANLLGF